MSTGESGRNASHNRKSLRKHHFKNRSSRWVWSDSNTSVMYSHDFINKCKSKPDTSKRAASGFIHSKERLKDTLPKLLRDSVPRIGYRQANALFLPECTYCDLSARMIIFDCVLNKIIYQPIDKNIASNYRYILAVPGQFYMLLPGKRF